MRRRGRRQRQLPQRFGIVPRHVSHKREIQILLVVAVLNAVLRARCLMLMIVILQWLGEAHRGQALLCKMDSGRRRVRSGPREKSCESLTARRSPRSRVPTRARRIAIVDLAILRKIRRTRCGAPGAGSAPTMSLSSIPPTVYPCSFIHSSRRYAPKSPCSSPETRAK